MSGTYGVRSRWTHLAIAIGIAFVGVQRANAAEDLRIGVPASLSGRFVSFGAQVQRGVDFAVEQWKAARGSASVAGHEIKVIAADTQSNTSTAVSVMNQLIQSDKVQVLVGDGASDIGAAEVPPWKQAPNHPVWLVPGVSTTVAENAVGKDPYYFHTFPWTYDYHSTNVDAFKTGIGTDKKVAVLYSDGAYGRAHIEATRKYLKAAGYQIVDEELVREGANDFTPALLKMRAQKPDMVYTLLQTSDAILVAKQIRSTNFKVPYLIGTFAAVLPEWKNAVGDIQECWTGVTTYLPGANFPADPKEPKLFPAGGVWEDQWRKRFNKEPEYMEAGSYVSTILALLAIEKSKSLDRDAIAKELAQANYNSVLGPTKFEPSEVGLHQAFSKMLVFQQQKNAKGGYDSVLVYPTALAKGKLQPCPT